MTEIDLEKLSIDADLQMRSNGIDIGIVAEYAEAMAAEAQFPAIVVFTDGVSYWPGDGFHRIEAAKRAGRDTIFADVRNGSRRDALLHAAGANSNHGLRRTQADKRQAIVSLLRDPEWSRWSDREIGRTCAVDPKTVAKVRAELTGDIPTDRNYTTRHGTVATMKVAPKAQAQGVSGSMVERLLAKAETAALIAECRRRGLEVVGHAD